MLKIASTQFSLETKSIDIYLSGCNGIPKCEGCHNPELWDFSIGSEYNNKYFSYLKNKIVSFDILVDNIFIMGGEPLDQDLNSLISFLSDLNTFKKDIWLFTRNEIEDIPQEVLNLISYVKTGRYDKRLICEDNIQHGVKLATSNQKIFKIK